MFLKGSQLSNVQIEQMLSNFFIKNEPLIEMWIASLLSRSEAKHQQKYFINPRIRDKKVFGYRTKVKTIVDWNYDFIININNNLTVSQIKLIKLISWFLPKDISAIITFCIEQIWKKKQLYNHIDLSVYMLSKEYSILQLVQSSSYTTESLFGQLQVLINFIRNEVNDDYSNNDFIFPKQFWYKQTLTQNLDVPDQGVIRYSGWRRHQNDHGSMRPDNYYRENILDDQEYQEFIQFKHSQFMNQNEHLLQLALGFII